jgi:hypothetical protein
MWWESWLRKNHPQRLLPELHRSSYRPPATPDPALPADTDLSVADAEEGKLQRILRLVQGNLRRSSC